ncbi:MAG: nitrilase-related carbon-nitrogen hydrolase, partial [Candidatus Kariarchaeaceae archaeon]
MDLQIVIYQMNVVFGDPQANMDKVETLFAENDVRDSLIILPELFLSGYHKETIDTLGSQEMYPELERLIALTAEHSCTLFGSIPLAIDGKCYNTAVLLQRGELKAKYAKSHLFGPMGEKDLFDSGRDIVTFDLFEGINAGFSICYDLRFPELFREQSSAGSNLFLICAEWPIQRVAHWDALLRARAIENQATVIACNRVGDDPDY